MKTKQNIFYSFLTFLLMSINIYAQDCGKIRVGYWSTYTIESKGAFTTQLNNLSNYGPHGSYNRINGFKFTNITTLLDTLTVDQLLAQFDIINTGYSNMTLLNAQKIKQYVDRGGVALIFLDAGSAVGSNLHQVFGGIGTIGNVNEQPSYASSTSNSLNNAIWGDARNISLKGYASSGLIAINQLPNASIQLANEGSNARVWITGNEGRAIFTWDEGIFNPGDSNVSGTDINTAQEKFIHNIMVYALDKIDKIDQCTDNCTTSAFLSQGPNNGVGLFTINTSFNPFDYPPVGSSSGVTYNGIGYNSKDGYLYAMMDHSNTVLKINPTTGKIINSLVITNLPSMAYSSGEIDQNGNYYVKAAAADNKLYKINLETLTATTINLNKSFSTSDFAYNIDDGFLYGVNAYSFGSGVTGGQLYKIDPTNGNVIPIGTKGSDIGNGNGSGVFSNLFGAMFGAAGDIYGALNGGGFYKFNITTGERTFISSSPSLPTGASDGAHCVSSPLVFSTDLYVTKTDGKSSYTAGSSTTYTIIAGNNGPFGVQGAIVRDPVPVGIPAENVSYTAVVSGGASSGITGTMTGSINDVISLPVGGKVTYTVKVHIPVSLTGNLTNTVSIASPPDSNDLDLNNNTATDTNINVGTCVRPGDFTSDGQPTKIGISTQNKLADWPEKVTNGWIALESNSQGMVITRVTHVSTTPDFINDAIKEPKEGMIVYDIRDKCVKLYNGTVWNCIKNTCDTVNETPRKIRIGSFAGYTIGKSNFSAYNSQLANLSNYGPTGTFKGITGFEFSDLSSAVLTSNTGDQLKKNYDIINTGYSSITSVQAQHIADFVKDGGVAIINLDNTAYNFNPILTAFGITGSNGNGAVSALSSSVNELSNVFGNTKNISLSGAATQGRVLANQLPSTSTVYANETVTGGGVAVWTIGGDFKGKVIFVWDEGVFRASAIAGTIIDTPQERFVHNLMAYALIQLGFQP